MQLSNLIGVDDNIESKDLEAFPANGMLLQSCWRVWKSPIDKTYSLVRIGPNEGKQLPQQDTVGGLISAVLKGQGLEQSEGAASMTCNVAPPTGGNTEKNKHPITPTGCL